MIPALINKLKATDILVLAIFLSPVFSWAQEKEQTTIVFVCEHGGARSTIASVYFNKLAKEYRLPYQSTFRGLIPDSVITKETKKGLTGDGFETTSLTPVALSPDVINSKTLLITLDCEVPTSYQKYRAWKGIPPISEDYTAARDSILKLLNELVKELKSNKTTSSIKH